jgi:hypothetical protein
MVHWFQMFHDDKYYEGCADHEFGVAIFERLRFELSFFIRESFGMRKLGIHYQNDAGLRLFIVDTTILNIRFFADDASYYTEDDKLIPARDYILDFELLGRVDFCIRLDSVPVYIYNVTEDGRIPSDANLTDRLNLIINPDYLER